MQNTLFLSSQGEILRNAVPSPRGCGKEYGIPLIFLLLSLNNCKEKKWKCSDLPRSLRLNPVDVLRSPLIAFRKQTSERGKQAGNRPPNATIASKGDGGQGAEATGTLF